MSTDTSTTDETTTESTEEEAPTFEKGTWQYDMQRSASLQDRAGKARKQASNLLWTGARNAIEEWLPNAKNDVSAENLAAQALTALGKARKGDASKIKTVAVAVKDHGLVLAAHPNLSKAYAEAVRLTKTQAQQVEEDDAAEAAISQISAPSSTTTVDGAAQILLSKGVDGAVVAILDTLGAKNEAAHRAFLRAVQTEIAARVQASKPAPVKKAAAPKGNATKATTANTATKAKPVKSAATKAKPTAAKKASPAKKAAPVPVSQSKGDPNSRPLPPRQQAETSTPEKKAAPVVIKR